MKKLTVITLLTGLALANSAFAKSNFDGIYLGLGTGYALGKDEGIEYQEGGHNGYSQVVDTNDVFVGAFVGINKVLNNNILVGLEADYDFRNSRDQSYQKDDGALDYLYPVRTEVKNSASIRARLGYVLNQDKTLAFLTGGLGTIKINRTFSDDEDRQSLSDNSRHNGFVVGAGLEHFLTDKVTIRLEYRHALYKRESVDVDYLYSDTFEKQKYKENSLKVGIAYKF
jgi:outer membrane immunogenic protein